MRKQLAVSVLLLVCTCVALADDETLPPMPAMVTATGVLFNGGSVSIDLTDANGEHWRLHHSPIEDPLPMPRLLGIQKITDDNQQEPVELAVGSDGETHIYNLLADWLGRSCSDEEIAGIRDESIWETFPQPGRSIFDEANHHAPPPEPDGRRDRIDHASRVIRLLEAIHVERAIASNPRLTAQHDEFIAHFKNPDPDNDNTTDEWMVRWQQFHDTARAALCGPTWSPTAPLTAHDDEEKPSHPR